MNKFIVNFTPNGIIPTKELTPHVPVKTIEIIKEVLDSRKHGVSIVHLHAREEDGTPTWKKNIFKEIIDGIRSVDGYDNNSLIICVSTSGRNWSDLKRRSECLDLDGLSKPDMGSLTLSSLNFNDSASINSPEIIQNLASKMLEKGIKPELEIFDSGMINYAKYLYKKGLIKPPFYFNLILGNISSAQANLIDSGYLILQLPSDAYWSLGGIGDKQLKMNTLGILNGGGVRIGLEDNIFFDQEKKELSTNMEMLIRMRKIAKLLASKPYTPAEVRNLLNLEIE